MTVTVTPVGVVVTITPPPLLESDGLEQTRPSIILILIVQDKLNLINYMLLNKKNQTHRFQAMCSRLARVDTACHERSRHSGTRNRPQDWRSGHTPSHDRHTPVAASRWRTTVLHRLRLGALRRRSPGKRAARRDAGTRSHTCRRARPARNVRLLSCTSNRSRRATVERRWSVRIAAAPPSTTRPTPRSPASNSRASCPARTSDGPATSYTIRACW